MTVRPLALVLAAGLLTAGCGGTRTPEQSGGPNAVLGAGARASAYDPRTTPLECIRGTGLPAAIDGPDAIRVGAGPGAPRAVFAPDGGTAQGTQIRGDSQGAEVIGSALLFTNAGDDALLGKIEKCLGKIVGY